MSLRGQSGPLMSDLGPSLPIRAFGTMSGLPPVATELRTSGSAASGQ